MKQSKQNKKRQNLYVIQQNKRQIKKTSRQKNKITPVIKFSRQSYYINSNHTGIKTSLIVPELNLININPPKQQLKQDKVEKQPTTTKKYVSRLQTKQTKDQLTSYRHSQQQHQPNKLFKQQLYASPTISNKFINSPIQTLLKSSKSRVESDSFNTQADRQQLLLLQIKQLKRQNTFLKKKIRDMKKQLNGGYLPQEYERKSPSNKQNHNIKQKKGFSKLNIESLHLSVNLFFQQIKNLLNSVAQLFRIQLTHQQIQQFKQLHSQQQIIHQLNQQICPLRKHQILKKYYLNRRLDRLSYQQDDKKYQLLLNIFMEYYSFKQSSEKIVVDTIDNMVGYTNQLNKWLIQKAYAKRNKSQVQSQRTTQRQFVRHISPISPPKFDSLKLPSNTINHVTKTRGPTFSPNPISKSNQKL